MTRTFEEIQQVVKSCEAGEGSHVELIALRRDLRGSLYIQGEYHERDAEGPVDGAPLLQKTRKWLVSPHSTDTEIVETVFAMLQRSADHRIREFFTYKGYPVKNRHISVDSLVETLQDTCLDHRAEAE